MLSFRSTSKSTFAPLCSSDGPACQEYTLLTTPVMPNADLIWGICHKHSRSNAYPLQLFLREVPMLFVQKCTSLLVFAMMKLRWKNLITDYQPESPCSTYRFLSFALWNPYFSIIITQRPSLRLPSRFSTPIDWSCEMYRWRVRNLTSIFCANSLVVILGVLRISSRITSCKSVSNFTLSFTPLFVTFVFSTTLSSMKAGWHGMSIKK